MKKNRREKIITDLATPIAKGQGFSVWGVYAPQAGDKATVAIYIEGPDGVNLDQCAQVSRDVALAIEVDDLIHGAYRLEVSSPGLERSFFELEQLAAYIGRKVKLELELPRDGRKKFSATLAKTNHDFFVIEDDENISHKIEWDQVKKVRLVHEF